LAIPALVVGTGFGARVHVPALRAAGFEIMGLVGTNADRLARKAADLSIPAHFTDLDEAITRTGAQAVSIATPPITHAGLVRTAIAHGCHVLCEKPFTLDAKEAAELVTAVEQANVVNLVAHEFRWQPERALFGRAIADGLIGEPRFLVIDQFLPMAADPNARLPNWWFDKACGGGWLGAAGSHLIDQIRAWLGEFASLSANLLVVSDRSDVADDSYSMRFLTQSGVEGSLQQSAGAWGEMATLWRCAGSRGTLSIERGIVRLSDASGTRDLSNPPDVVLPTMAEGDQHTPYELGAFTALAQTFAVAIRDRAGLSASMPNFRNSLGTMRVLDAIRRSAEQGGKLQRLC
jgi:predicted dehydrogenase